MGQIVRLERGVSKEGQYFHLHASFERSPTVDMSSFSDIIENILVEFRLFSPFRCPDPRQHVEGQEGPSGCQQALQAKPETDRLGG